MARKYLITVSEETNQIINDIKIDGLKNNTSLSVAGIIDVALNITNELKKHKPELYAQLTGWEGNSHE